MRLLTRPNLDFLHETIADADEAELELIEARQTGEKFLSRRAFRRALIERLAERIKRHEIVTASACVR